MCSFYSTILVHSKQACTDSKEYADMMKYAKNWTRSIEIKYMYLSNEKRSEVLTRVYFPFDPEYAVCYALLR